MGLRLAAAGDAIITRRVRQLGEPGFRNVAEIPQGADAGFVNLELACPRPPFTPGIKGHGIYISAPPGVIDDLAWLGFGLYSNANNHALDYSGAGLLDTLAELDRRGLAHAGAGATLEQARQPVYLDTANGRLALIATTTTWSDRMLAADPRGPIGGRPGICPLRYRTRYGIDAAGLAAVVDLRRRILGNGSLYADPAGVRFLDQEFRTDLAPGVRTALHEPDLTALVRWIREAREQADLVVVSLHFHEGPGGTLNTSEPAEHVVEAAHRLVDAGADAILGHGPHRLNGVETYRGRPILYSLGNLFFMLETIAVLPPECFENEGLPPDSTVASYARTDVHRVLYTAPMWVSAVAVLDFAGGGTTVELWPVDLGLDRRGPTRGVPLLARGERGADILAAVGDLSAALGTHVEIVRRGSTPVGVVSCGPVRDHQPLTVQPPSQATTWPVTNEDSSPTR